MSAGSTAKVLLKGAAFRATGWRRLGRALTHAFLGDDESARTAAGILLVRAGDRSVRVLSEGLAGGPGAAGLIEVLGSIDTPKADAALRRIADEPGHPAAARAREALELRAAR